MRIYAESIGGRLYRYRNNVSGLGVDAIAELKNGDYAAIEIDGVYVFPITALRN